MCVCVCGPAWYLFIGAALTTSVQWTLSFSLYVLLFLIGQETVWLWCQGVCVPWFVSVWACVSVYLLKLFFLSLLLFFSFSIHPIFFTFLPSIHPSFPLSLHPACLPYCLLIILSLSFSFVPSFFPFFYPIFLIPSFFPVFYPIFLIPSFFPFFYPIFLLHSFSHSFLPAFLFAFFFLSHFLSFFSFIHPIVPSCLSLFPSIFPLSLSFCFSHTSFLSSFCV